jgi:hypothetical protein
VELEGTLLLGLIAAAELATVVRLIKVYVSLLAPYCRERETEGEAKKKAIR